MTDQPRTTIVSFVDPQPPQYTHVDPDGDRLLITTADIPGQGAGVYFRTDQNGSGVPVAEIPELIERLKEIAEEAEAVQR
ncbi:hypothetical protein AB0M68_03810 [Streptomyces sp. NPDC051453]|uniref:hypothetical protein n=1 Tax=Streptomyces sp. NPDC051453 TaxID=3154941 RepID=UPI00341E4EC1